MAFAVCAALGNGTVFCGARGGRFRITGRLTIDTNTTGFDGHGCELDCATVTTGSVWTPTQSIADVNLRVHHNNAHPIRNFTMRGPGNGNTATIAISLSDPGKLTIAGLVFSNLGLFGFGTDVYFGAGAFCSTFVSCTFAPGNGLGGGAVYSIIQDPTAANTGERQTFINCGWYNKQEVISQGGNSNFQLYGCSIDVYSARPTAHISVTGGRFLMHGGHIELISGDLGPIGFVSGTNAAIMLHGVEIIVQADRAQCDLFTADSSAQNGGVVLLGCSLQNSGSAGTMLIGGSGAALVKQLRTQGNIARYPLARAVNLLAYPDFESASYANDWVLSNGAARSNAQAHTGAWSLALPSVSGSDARAVATRRCEPAQMLCGELWMRADNINTTGGFFFGEVRYLDAAGGTIAAIALFRISKNTQGWVRQSISPLAPAPPGTVNVQLVLGTAGVGSGRMQAYADDVILNLT